MPDKLTNPRSRSRSPTRPSSTSRPTIGEESTSGPSRRSASPDRAGLGTRSSGSQAHPPTPAVPTSTALREHLDGVPYGPFSVRLPRWRAPSSTIRGDTRRENRVRFDGLPPSLGNSSSDTPAESSSNSRRPDTAPVAAPSSPAESDQPAPMSQREQLRRFRIERDARLAASLAGSSSTSTAPPRPSTRTTRPASANSAARNSSNPPRLPATPELQTPGTFGWLFALQSDASGSGAAPTPSPPRIETAPLPRDDPFPPPNPAFFTPWPFVHFPMPAHITPAPRPARPRFIPGIDGVVPVFPPAMGPFGLVGRAPNPPHRPRETPRDDTTMPQDGPRPTPPFVLPGQGLNGDGTGVPPVMTMMDYRMLPALSGTENQPEAGQAGGNFGGPFNGRPQGYYHFIHVNFDYTTASYPHYRLARELVAALTDVDKKEIRKLNEMAKMESDIPQGEEEEKWTCGICLDHAEGVDEGKESESSGIRGTPCEHLFHGQCLEEWFKTSYTCPLCRRDLEYVVNPEPELEAPGTHEGQNHDREPSSDLSDDGWEL